MSQKAIGLYDYTRVRGSVAALRARCYDSGFHDTHRPKPTADRHPWRTSQEEVAGNVPKIRDYMEAVEQAGGEPVLLSLAHPEALPQEIAGLEGFVLPGSPADVNPSEYGASNRGQSEALT